MAGAYDIILWQLEQGENSFTYTLRAEIDRDTVEECRTAFEAFRESARPGDKGLTFFDLEHDPDYDPDAAMSP